MTTNSPYDSAFDVSLLNAGMVSERALPHTEEAIQLFSTFRRPLLRYALTFGIGVCDVEEIVQETFLALFRHLKAGKSRENLPGWIFRVCHNLALRHVEKHHGRKLFVTAEAEWLTQRADHAPNPEEQVLDAQRRQRLQSVLRALPEQDRFCICLRAEGLRYREIAEVLGMSLGAVSLSLTRSLAKFERADQE
jgi:RNA polymerase sigma-70 factor (ECF subfamily)